jgi:uncharacterized protein (TIGR02117 family)
VAWADRRRPRWLRDLPLLALALLMLAGVATARRGDPALYPPRPGDAVTVFLIDNGFHTDIALPRDALAGHAAGRAAAMATDKPWVAIGWGDERFFMAQTPMSGRLLDGLRSLFLPGNASAIRFDGLRDAPDRIYEARSVHAVQLSHAGLARLAGRLDRSLALAGGQPVRIPGEAAPDTAFFRSVETFSLIHLCNHWTAELLNAAGLPTTPVLDTVPAGLRLDLRMRAKT